VGLQATTSTRTTSPTTRSSRTQRRRSMGAIIRIETSAKGTWRGRLMKLASRAAATVAIAAVTTARLLAHDPGLSSLDVRIEPHEMIAALSLAAGDARIIGNTEAVATLARDSIEVV